MTQYLLNDTNFIIIQFFFYFLEIFQRKRLREVNIDVDVTSFLDRHIQQYNLYFCVYKKKNI